MPSRVNSIINKRIRRGITRANVRVPNDAEEIQVVFDRTKFEIGTTRYVPLYRVGLYSGNQYLGGAEFGGGEITATTGARPGQRPLWDWGRWAIPDDVRTVSVQVEAYFDFECDLDVDFFILLFVIYLLKYS